MWSVPIGGIVDVLVAMESQNLQVAIQRICIPFSRRLRQTEKALSAFLITNSQDSGHGGAEHPETFTYL